MVIISLELMRVNTDRNVFSINVEHLFYLLCEVGLEHYQHQILNAYTLYYPKKRGPGLLISIIRIKCYFADLFTRNSPA